MFVGRFFRVLSKTPRQRNMSVALFSLLCYDFVADILFIPKGGLFWKM